MKKKEPDWLLLIVQLPGRKPTLRMQIWRALTASGAELLRDGAYLLPNSTDSRQILEAQATKLIAAGGISYVVSFEADSIAQKESFIALFDRSKLYAELIARLVTQTRKFAKSRETQARQTLATAQREAAAIVAKDFFPGKAQQQMHAVLADAQGMFNARFVPDEPHPSRRPIQTLDCKHYQARTWATRERLWIDRVASAWLIRRFIDPKAKFLWLKDIKKKPARSVGFDFDGAEFTHVGAKVTFEVLMASFGFEQDSGLSGLAALVHYLDVGGIPVAEAAGFTAIMSGARLQEQSDDALLKMMTPILNSLYATYRKDDG